MNVFAELIVAIILSVVVAVMTGVLDPALGAIAGLIIFGFCIVRMAMGKGIYKYFTNKSNDD